MANTPLLLASKSPRRRELMHLITPAFGVCDAHVDESEISASTPAHLAQALATAKVQAAFSQYGDSAVIGCDTVVDFEGRVLGKPQDKQQAIDMLRLLAGNMHIVHTGVCICTPHAGGRATVFTASSRVFFSDIPLQEIEAYADTAEPYDKAGGYGIQGWAARFIPRIEGCYYNVMGLPVAALYTAMTQCALL